LGVAYPFLPPAPAKDPIRSARGSVTGASEPPPDAGSERVVALDPNESTRLRLTSAGVRAAVDNIEPAAVPPSPDSDGFNPPANQPLLSGGAVLSDGTLAAEHTKETSADTPPAASEAGHVSDTTSAGAAVDCHGLALKAPHAPSERDGAIAASIEISMHSESWPSRGQRGLPAQPLAAVAGESRRPVSQRPAPGSGVEPTDEALSIVRLGTELAAAADPSAILAAWVSADAAVAGAPVLSNQRKGAGVPAGLAFTARLVPLPAASAAVPLPAAALAPVADEKPPEAISGDSANSNATRTPAPQAPRISKDLKDDASREFRGTDPSPETAAARALPSLAPAPAQPPAGSADDSFTKEPTAPPPPQAGVTEATKDPAPAAAPAREIQLQIQHGEQRVDVRLSERSGEVRVAVRTPDAQLAGALRADLPSLSTRLEQTGFRAETWHPGIFHESTRHPASAAPAFSDSTGGQNGSRQGGQQQPEPRQPRPNAAQTAAKSQRKEFRWLMSQLP
jgi:hypothetical protein